MRQFEVFNIGSLPVGDDDLLLRGAAGEQFVEMLHVAVPVDGHHSLLMALHHPEAVDDGCVIQGVGEHCDLLVGGQLP